MPLSATNPLTRSILSQEDDGEEDENDIEGLVKNLPPELRQKVLRGGDGEDDDDDEAIENPDEDYQGWGKKSEYWSGGTGEIEDEDDNQVAKEEEAAVKVYIKA